MPADGWPDARARRAAHGMARARHAVLSRDNRMHTCMQSLLVPQGLQPGDYPPQLTQFGADVDAQSLFWKARRVQALVMQVRACSCQVRRLLTLYGMSGADTTEPRSWPAARASGRCVAIPCTPRKQQLLPAAHHLAAGLCCSGARRAGRHCCVRAGR